MGDSTDHAVPERYRPDDPKGSGHKLHPTVETKPPDGYGNGGYERVRSWEVDPETGEKTDVYAAIHRLCVVAWSDRDRPLEDVLDELYPPTRPDDPNEVHHVQHHVEDFGDFSVETDFPCGRFANIDGNLVVTHPTDHAHHHDHLGVCVPGEDAEETEAGVTVGD